MPDGLAGPAARQDVRGSARDHDDPRAPRLRDQGARRALAARSRLIYEAASPPQGKAWSSRGSSLLAIIKLARAFPNSKFVGYDISEAQIERARKNVEDAGFADRVRIELKDVVKGLDEKFDVISTYDVIHDAVDPQGLLKAIRQGLKEDGIYLCLDINCADDPADNQGPLASMFYGFSMLYCMTTSLAHDGEGLGTCGLPEAKLRELCENAGFSKVRRIEMDNPFNNLYEVLA